MSESFPQSQGPELPDLRPGEEGYIQDAEKAMVMAYASKGAEEAAVEANNAALEASSHLGEGGWIHDVGVKRETNRQFRAAENAREIANSQAEAAANVYDKFDDLAGANVSKTSFGYDKRSMVSEERAMYTAHATQESEEAVVRARNAGLEAAMHIGDKNWRSNQPEGQHEAAQADTEATRAERFKARAGKVGGSVLRLTGLSQERSANREVAHQLKTAEKARAKADKQADVVARTYNSFYAPPTVDRETIEDTQKAEFMEQASRNHEQLAEHARRQALEAATRTGEKGLSALEVKLEIARQQLLYKKAKLDAKKRATVAGKAYDFRTRKRSHYRRAA